MPAAHAMLECIITKPGANMRFVINLAAARLAFLRDQQVWLFSPETKQYVCRKS